MCCVLRSERDTEHLRGVGKLIHPFIGRRRLRCCLVYPSAIHSNRQTHPPSAWTDRCLPTGNVAGDYLERKHYKLKSSLS